MSPFALLGVALGLVAVAFVLYPLVAPERVSTRTAEPSLEERRRLIYRQILDLEFDVELGKLGEADGGEAIDGLLREAASLMAAESRTDLELEREVAEVRRALAALRGSELEPAQP